MAASVAFTKTRWTEGRSARSSNSTQEHPSPLWELNAGGSGEPSKVFFAANTRTGTAIMPAPPLHDICLWCLCTYETQAHLLICSVPCRFLCRCCWASYQLPCNYSERLSLSEVATAPGTKTLQNWFIYKIEPHQITDPVQTRDFRQLEKSCSEIVRLQSSARYNFNPTGSSFGLSLLTFIMCWPILLAINACLRSLHLKAIIL